MGLSRWFNMSTSRAEKQTVADALEHLSLKRIPLLLESPGCDQQAYALVTTIEKRRLILLDMSADSILRGWCKQQTVHVSSSPIDGKKTIFQSLYLAPLAKGENLHSVVLPHKVDIIDRRTQPRVSIGVSREVLVPLMVQQSMTHDEWLNKILPQQMRHEGQLTDISLCGMHLSFNHDMREIFNIDDTVTTAIDLSDSQLHLACQATIRWCYYHEESGTTHVGCCFKQLTPDAQQTIGHFIAQLKADFYHRYL